MNAAQVELAETAGPSTALASLRSGRDDNANSTNFRDRTLAFGCRSWHPFGYATLVAHLYCLQ